MFTIDEKYLVAYIWRMLLIEARISSQVADTVDLLISNGESEVYPNMIEDNIRRNYQNQIEFWREEYSYKEEA